MLTEAMKSVAYTQKYSCVWPYKDLPWHSALNSPEQDAFRADESRYNEANKSKAEVADAYGD